MDENKLLLATIEDKYDRFLDYYSVVATDFLTLTQQTVARGFFKEHRGVNGFFYGGYEDAERRMIIFAPDYINAGNEEALRRYFVENPEECPMVILDVSYNVKGSPILGHRDYLGSLLGEGIKREKVGDILVREGGAQIIVMRELAEYLQRQYGKAGRVSLDVKILPISEINPGISSKEVVKFTVSSPRLDNIVSSIFNLSRKDSQAAINQGRVLVNSIEVCKPDYNLKDGEKVVLRGKGKAVFTGVTGTSKKGKCIVTMEKYV